MRWAGLIALWGGEGRRIQVTPRSLSCWIGKYFNIMVVVLRRFAEASNVSWDPPVVPRNFGCHNIADKEKYVDYLFKINFNYTYVVRGKHNIGKMIILLNMHARVPDSPAVLPTKTFSVTRFLAGRNSWPWAEKRKFWGHCGVSVRFIWKLKYRFW